MTELLPCPFCGEPNVEMEAGPDHRHWPAVRCNECGALGPSIKMDHLGAKEDWNTRSTRPALAQGARQPCGCGVVCQDLGKEAGCRYMQPSRRDLRKLVDLVYQHAADCVPMTLTADKLIDEVFGPAEAPEHTEGSR